MTRKFTLVSNVDIKVWRVFLFVAKRRSSPKVLFLQINFFFLFFIYTVIELVKMSSSSNLQYEEIPKKYIDPLAPKDKGEGSRVNGKDWKIKKDAFRVKTLGVVSKTKRIHSSNVS